MGRLLLVPLVVLLGACTSSTVLQEQSKELQVLGDYHKAERAYTRSQVALEVATSARDNAAAVEAKAKLELDRAKEELLKMIK